VRVVFGRIHGVRRHMPRRDTRRTPKRETDIPTPTSAQPDVKAGDEEFPSAGVPHDDDDQRRDAARRARRALEGDAGDAGASGRE